MCKSDKEGGMIVIFNYVKALKITWIQKLKMKDSKWKPILFAFFPYLVILLYMTMTTLRDGEKY